MLFDYASLAFGFILASASRCDFACLHKLANISVARLSNAGRMDGGAHSRLKESVAALEFFVFGPDYLDAVDDFHEAGLQLLGLAGGMSVAVKHGVSDHDDSLNQSLAGFLAHLLNLLAAPPRAHGASIVVVVFLLLELDLRAVARDDDGAARLPAA